MTPDIHITPNRGGYTFIPDYNEVTGEIDIENGSVAPTNMKNWVDDPDLNFQGQDPTSYEDVSPEEELIAEDPDHPDFELDAVVLADISDEIHNTPVSYDQEMADSIIQAPMSDSPADVTVQYLASQVYSGNISSEEAFNEAMNSGVDPALLAQSWRKLQSHFRQ